jgi:hypothetical protein
MKRSPGELHSRYWSSYAEFNCRHLNELEYEMRNRLNSAIEAATAYQNSFSRRSVGIVKY